ncbi:hypothetical protein AAT19DRAFT_9072 [Rhodotorula toruloides]|uniref:Uncharacterized protein n=1 Tax=Rhodotorula toruloides TaxID=5286 RepID=A0A2T0AJ31_RHOTO|nr:hypothetical protein AAT19DRAFT_9072 [Rhodotorula toruloides]
MQPRLQSTTPPTPPSPPKQPPRTALRLVERRGRGEARRRANRLAVGAFLVEGVDGRSGLRGGLGSGLGGLRGCRWLTGGAIETAMFGTDRAGVQQSSEAKERQKCPKNRFERFRAAGTSGQREQRKYERELARTGMTGPNRCCWVNCCPRQYTSGPSRRPGLQRRSSGKQRASCQAAAPSSRCQTPALGSSCSCRRSGGLSDSTGWKSRGRIRRLGREERKSRLRQATSCRRSGRKCYSILALGCRSTARGGCRCRCVSRTRAGARRPEEGRGGG